MGATGNWGTVGEIGQVEQQRADSVAAIGPLSDLVCDLIVRSPPPPVSASIGAAEKARPLADEVEDPLADDDLQLALYVCFELHYRGFSGVDPAWEWNPVLLAVRGVMEEAFLAALDVEIGLGDTVDPCQMGDLLFQLEAEDEGVALSRRPGGGRGPRMLS